MSRYEPLSDILFLKLLYKTKSISVVTRIRVSVVKLQLKYKAHSIYIRPCFDYILHVVNEIPDLKQNWVWHTLEAIIFVHNEEAKPNRKMCSKTLHRYIIKTLKHNTNPIYLSRHFEFLILLKTIQLTFQFWINIMNTLVKHFTHVKLENIILKTYLN